MLPHHDRAHRAHVVGIVRDTVEVVAIVAAGIWAFYTFIYENRIVPSFVQPTVNFTATLQKVSVHNGLIGVRMDTEIRNIGVVHVHFVALATAVMGERIVPVPQPTKVASPVVDDQLYLSPFSHVASRVPVYETGFVTNLGDPHTRSDLPLEPGEDDRNQVIFYVPAGRFDRLAVYMIARYTRNDDKPIPTRLFVGKDGLPQMDGDRPESEDEFSTFVTSLDLNGP